MGLDWHPKAVEEFLNLDESIQELVNNRIEKLPEKGLEWEKVGLVDRSEIGLSCYRLKVVGEDSRLNHRVLFRVKDEKFLILKVGKRPNFYDLENLEEARNRLKGE